MPAIGMKSNTTNNVGVSSQFTDQPAAFDIPQADDLVVPGRGEQACIPGERNARDLPFVILEDAQLSLCCQVLDAEGAILASGGESPLRGLKEKTVVRRRR